MQLFLSSFVLEALIITEYGVFFIGENDESRRQNGCRSIFRLIANRQNAHHRTCLRGRGMIFVFVFFVEIQKTSLKKSFYTFEQIRRLHHDIIYIHIGNNSVYISELRLCSVVNRE
jgi:hypothetical protein